MKDKIFLLLFILLIAGVVAVSYMPDVYSQAVNPILNITEEDASPSVYPYKVKFTNGSLTDNGDGTVSVAISGGTATSTSPTLAQIQAACTNDFHNIGGTDANTTYTGGDFLTLTGTDFDVDNAAVTNGDTTHLPSSDQVYDFCETTQNYLQSADLSGYVPYTGATTNVDLGLNSISASTVRGGYLYSGFDDLYRGFLVLYGDDDDTYGGGVFLQTSAGYDTTVDRYDIITNREDLWIGPDTDIDAIKIDKDANLWVTAGNAYVKNALSVTTASIADEEYGASWNASTQAPTKNAVYDKIQSISSASGVPYTGATQDVILGAFGLSGDVLSGTTAVFTPSLNNTLYIDGSTYERSSAGITAAIAALPATGGTIICTPGTYIFTSKVTVDKPVWFRGSGMGTDTAHFGAGWLVPDVTYFKIANGAHCGFFLFDAGTDHGAGGGFQDIGFDGNLANNATAESLIAFTDWSDVRFKDCFFVNQDNASYSCIETDATCWGMWFDGTQFEDCDGIGLNLQGHRYWINNCHFRATLKGIVFDNDGSEIGLMASNCDFRDNDQEAIYLHKGTISFLENIHIYNASAASAGTDDGIFIDDTTLAVWMNNVYVYGNSNTNYGINISDANSDYIFVQDLLTYATVAGPATVNAAANTYGRISYQVLGGSPTIYSKTSIVYSGSAINPSYGISPATYQDHANLVILRQAGDVYNIDIDYTGLNIGGVYDTAGNITIDCNTGTGANCIDTGSLAASTWYYIWVIFSPSTAAEAGLLSLSSTAPTLPSGYTLYRRVGFCRTTADTEIRDFHTNAYGRHYYDTYYQILTNGTQTSFTAVDCSTLVPPTSTLFIGFMSTNDNDPTTAIKLRATGDTNFQSNVYSSITGATNVTTISTVMQPTNSSQSVDYLVDTGDAAGNLYITGCDDNL